MHLIPGCPSSVLLSSLTISLSTPLHLTTVNPDVFLVLVLEPEPPTQPKTSLIPPCCFWLLHPRWLTWTTGAAWAPPRAVPTCGAWPQRAPALTAGGGSAGRAVGAWASATTGLACMPAGCSTRAAAAPTALPTTEASLRSRAWGCRRRLQAPTSRFHTFSTTQVSRWEGQGPLNAAS